MNIKVLLAGLMAPLLLAAAVDAGFGVPREAAFSRSAHSLELSWTEDLARGVPASSIDPLREELASRQPGSSWWSPAWIREDGNRTISDLQARTAAAWQAALADARHRAQAALSAFQAYQAQESAWIPADVAGAVKGWPAQLAGAATPAAADDLAGRWTATLAGTKTAVEAAKAAHLAQLLAAAGGRAGLVSTARALTSTADADSLDSAAVQGLLPAVAAEADEGQPPTKADQDLLAAVSALQSLIDLNDSLGGQMRPIYLSTLQARGEGTPSADSFSSRYQEVSSAYTAGRTNADLTKVQQDVTALQAAINAELQAHNCGYPVPAGKAITINLSLQEMLFYQDGCVVNATPVSTGRPDLRTPTGFYRIFDKESPFIFHSSWPKDSPYWYRDSPASWVMEFAGGGYFIHDASWEPEGLYGPGSENIPDAASHGCVHTPTSVMRWAYEWTPYGTPVIIT